LHTRARGERYIGPRTVDPVIRGPLDAARPERKAATTRRVRKPRYRSSSTDSDGPESVDVPQLTSLPGLGMKWGTVYLPSGERAGTGIVASNGTVVVPGFGQRRARGRKRLFIGAPRAGWRALAAAGSDDDERLRADAELAPDAPPTDEHPRRRWFVGKAAPLRRRMEDADARAALPPDPHEPRYDPSRSESPLTVLSDTDADAESETIGGSEADVPKSPVHAVSGDRLRLSEEVLANVITIALAAATEEGRMKGPLATLR
jgi:hypothetical protein